MLRKYFSIGSSVFRSFFALELVVSCAKKKGFGSGSFSTFRLFLFFLRSVSKLGEKIMFVVEAGVLQSVSKYGPK